MDKAERMALRKRRLERLGKWSQPTSENTPPKIIAPPINIITPKVGDVKFSILICSLVERKQMLDRLLGILEPQLQGKAEIITNIDNREKTVGTKRNELLDQCKTEYCCFVDDDDRVPANYVDSIHQAIQKKPDCTSLEGIISFTNGLKRLFIHSLKYDSWFERNNVYFRTPNHLNCIKTELSRQVRFPEINSGEDHNFSNRIYPLLKTEENIPGILYYYDYIEGKK